MMVSEIQFLATMQKNVRGQWFSTLKAILIGQALEFIKATWTIKMRKSCAVDRRVFQYRIIRSESFTKFFVDVHYLESKENIAIVRIWEQWWFA